jgi:hypothetical protein
MSDTTIPAAPPANAAAALEAWLDRHVRNSAYSRDIEGWNRIHGAVQTIRAVLAQIDQTGGK